MARNLPIQTVKPREEIDQFLKEGSGGKPPRWVTDDAIQINATNIKASLGQISGIFDERLEINQGLPILMTAHLNPKATAKSYRPNIRSVFDVRRQKNVIGVEGLMSLFVKVDSQDDLDAIVRSINNVVDGKSSKDKPIGVAAVTNVTPYRPMIDFENLHGKTVKIRLIDYQSAKFNALAKERFERLCADEGIRYQTIRYADDLTLYKIDEADDKVLRRIATMDSVISIKEMPYFEISAAPEPWYNDIDINTPADGVKYPAIGILDSGVADTLHLSPWQLGDEDNIVGLEDHDIDKTHGTMVTSVAVYGDALEGKKITGCGPLQYRSFIVNTDPRYARVSEDEIVLYVRDAVSKHPEVKVWNFSQGSEEEVDDCHFSDFAIALDDIQRKYNVLICKSSGNAERNSESHRITLGAESLRCLTVGSICNEGSEPDDFPEGTLSPFSRIGPGPEHLLKPEVVQYGGNSRTGVKVLTGVDIMHRVFGTSFSTPRVAALAAHLAHQVGGEFDPTLIKALIIHNAQYPTVLGKNVKSVVNSYGFGQPVPIDTILNNDENEITLVWHPDLNAGTDYQILDFPFPESLVDENGDYYGIVTATVVTDPALRSSEGNEYCQTDVDVLLEAFDRVEYVNIGAAGIPQTYRNSARVKDAINILSQRHYSRHQPELFRERNLIESGAKWQSSKKFQVDLSTVTPAVKKKLRDKKKWVLKVKAITRDATADAFANLGEINEIKATIIITIRDPKCKGVVYNEAIRLLDQRNFEHTDVIVRNEIRIEGGVGN